MAYFQRQEVSEDPHVPQFPEDSHFSEEPLIEDEDDMGSMSGPSPVIEPGLGGSMPAVHHGSHQIITLGNLIMTILGIILVIMLIYLLIQLFTFIQADLLDTFPVLANLT